MHDYMCIKEPFCQQSNSVVALHNDQVTHHSGKKIKIQLTHKRKWQCSFHSFIAVCSIDLDSTGHFRMQLNILEFAI